MPVRVHVHVHVHLHLYLHLRLHLNVHVHAYVCIPAAVPVLFKAAWRRCSSAFTIQPIRSLIIYSRSCVGQQVVIGMLLNSARDQIRYGHNGRNPDCGH